MINTQNNLINYLEKAYELTRQGLKEVQAYEIEKLNLTLDNRERILNIIESLSEQMSLYAKDKSNNLEEFNNQVNQVIAKICKMDDIIAECLEAEKNKTQIEIAKTHKNKENFKGYNLNNLK